ncbi:hypothetical protein [Enterovibrio norvegicus]|uniref:hypothetical protein n=1 Tax=Enterovibrio norvegicus TaxID=188144 RepID=UPI0013000790|nr:hypothetical protein [Enterovibrio norvegicus]
MAIMTNTEEMKAVFERLSRAALIDSKDGVSTVATNDLAALLMCYTLETLKETSPPR